MTNFKWNCVFESNATFKIDFPCVAIFDIIDPIINYSFLFKSILFLSFSNKVLPFQSWFSSFFVIVTFGLNVTLTVFYLSDNLKKESISSVRIDHWMTSLLLEAIKRGKKEKDIAIFQCQKKNIKQTLP